MQSHLATDLVLAALEMALRNRQPEAGLMHHSYAWRVMISHKAPVP
jgi:hypothetical protein